MQQLALEAAIVGLVLAAALAAAVRLGGPIASAADAARVGLVLGALVHLGFEASGLNARYCAVGAACSGA